MPEPIYNLQLSKGRGAYEDSLPTEVPSAAIKPQSLGPEVALDVSRETYLDDQMAVDANQGETNLLNENAPKE
jgi:hypothetical protein